jgi:uncharacterized iron-regulated membrane protein
MWGKKYSSVAIYFDANTGKKLFSYLPSTAASGDTVSEWLSALHMAQVWGLPMQIFVSFMGFVVTGLTVTGVVIWWIKRKSRLIIHNQKLQNI